MSGPTDLERYLVFSLGAEEYALPLLTVREVIAIPEITPVPQSPPYFLGIMNLRGQVISVVDLRLKMGIKSANTAETSVVILDLGEQSLGAVVDSVNSVLTPKPDQISPPPEMSDHKNAQFISSVIRKESSLVLILDVYKSLSKEDKAAMARPSAKVA